MSAIGAGFPPSRDPPPRRDHAVSTGGLVPRTYRSCLARDDAAFDGVSEFDSTTIHRRRVSPLIGTALHYNHAIREGLRPKLGADAETRFVEEDPWTHRFLEALPHTLTPNQSRFEFDANRPPDTTVYTTPELAWGIPTWREPMTQYEREFTLEKWYELHTFMDCAVEDAINRFGRAIVVEFHSYNYQRQGPTDWRKDGKPVINVGTRHLKTDDEGRQILDWFMREARNHTVLGEEALVEENGVFYGGYLNRRLAHLYGPKVLTLSIEYKKVYMDERTGELFPEVLDDLVSQMTETLQGLSNAFGLPGLDVPECPVPDPAYPQPRPAV